MQASEVLTTVSQLLVDEGRVRWTEPTLLSALNEAVLAVIQIRPDAAVGSGEITLVAGASQVTPAGALRLLDISHNVNGVPVRFTDREEMDRVLPTWRSASQSSTVKHWMYDNKYPKMFDVYPPAKAGAKVVGKWSVIPTTMTATDDDVPIDDVYKSALIEFALFRCYSVDTEFSAQPGIAGTHLNNFMLMLGQKTSKDIAFSPALNQRNATIDPSIQMGAV